MKDDIKEEMEVLVVANPEARNSRNILLSHKKVPAEVPTLRKLRSQTSQQIKSRKNHPDQYF